MHAKSSSKKAMKNRSFIIITISFGMLFLSLLSIRMGIFDQTPEVLETASIKPAADFSGKETWKNILQNNKKIGFSHSRYTRTDDGFRFSESLFMRINTMGMVQDIGLKTKGLLNSDFSLKSFDFNIESGRFNFSAGGTIAAKILNLETRSAGSSQNHQINLTDDIYFTSGIVQAASAGNLKPGDRLSLKIFDPLAMGQEPINLQVQEPEEIIIMGERQEALRIALEYKGAEQLAWVDADGNILREKGILGIILEKTSRQEAINGLPIQSSQDLTEIASIPANLKLTDPKNLRQLRLEITGTGKYNGELHGGRQHYDSPLLTITKELIPSHPSDHTSKSFSTDQTRFLQPSPFIQSDHVAIQRLAKELVRPDDAPLDKARKLIAWMQAHIQKRPVISLPDALATLTNRAGDCNEHAVLFAALARAAGIPTRIEAGLVFLRQRFFYHAWNSIYVDEWITVDALFDQIPADVTHIRLASGMQEDQLDILSLIGNLKIKILEAIPTS